MKFTTNTFSPKTTLTLREVIVKLAKKKRDYKKEYRDYHSKPAQRKNRSKRNQARRKMGLKKGDKREVDIKSRCQKVEVIKSPIFGLLVGGQTEEKRQSRNFISGREVRN